MPVDSNAMPQLHPPLPPQLSVLASLPMTGVQVEPVAWCAATGHGSMRLPRARSPPGEDATARRTAGHAEPPNSDRPRCVLDKKAAKQLPAAEGKQGRRALDAENGSGPRRAQRPPAADAEHGHFPEQRGSRSPQCGPCSPERGSRSAAAKRRADASPERAAVAAKRKADVSPEAR
jgi:hypothetical protein